MQTLAVVPIFMSAGAAVLPTVLAAGASIAAIVFKPRELARVSRQHPRGVALTLLVLALAGAGTAWGVHAALQPRVVVVRAGEKYDWAQIAAGIINRHEAGMAYTELRSVAAGGAPAGPAPSTQAALMPVADPRTTDFARTQFAGGDSPTGLKQLWSYKPDGTMFLSEPAIIKTAAGTRIYAAACVADLGGYTGMLSCVDGETGASIWENTFIGDDIMKPYFSSPAVTADGKYLVVGQGLHQDKDCALLCFETATGKLKWQVKTPLHIESSPALYGDLAVVGAGAIEDTTGRAVGNPGFVLAVRVSTGEKLWEQPVNDPESAPAIDAEGNVYIGSGFNGEALVAMRSGSDAELKEKGQQRLLWKTPVGLPCTGDITLAGDLVIAGAGNGDFVHSAPNARGVVVAVERATGKIRWQTAVDDSVLGDIAYRDGKLICPARTGDVFALAADTGKVLWKTRLSGKNPVLAGPCFTDKRIYATSSDGYLAVLNPADGKMLEKVAINDQSKPGSGLSSCPPQVFGGRVIAGSETGGIVCLYGRPAGGVP